MKATGITRKIDELGRITLPIELRRTLDIQVDTQMEIFVDGKNIIVRKYEPVDVEKVRTTFELEQLLKEISNDQQREVILKAIEQLKG